MVRNIVKIDEEKCTGCGLCVEACHEGAIGLVNGKAKLLRDDYCDGLGDCLPACPADAILFEKREAAEYDADAVLRRRAEKQAVGPACGCPGTQAQTIRRASGQSAAPEEAKSRLSQWPVQLKLAPLTAPYFAGADLLIAADCTAYAYGNFHDRFIQNRITLVGCPKLDAGDYSEKLTAILKSNSIRSVTVVRMEVPCCGGLVNAVETALRNSGKTIPWQVTTISTDGRLLD